MDAFLNVTIDFVNKANYQPINYETGATTGDSLSTLIMLALICVACISGICLV